MKRSILWGVSLILTGAVLWWGSQTITEAEHRTPATGYNPANVGQPNDEVSDASPDKPGSEQVQRDRNPDRPTGTATAGDLTDDGVPDRSTNRDGVPGVPPTPDRTEQRDAGVDRDPDCGNGPGDGNCGNSPNAGDGRADNFGAGDDIADNLPDRPIALNRTLDQVTDGLPDAPWKDRFLLLDGVGPDTVNDRVGVRDCLAADIAVGECDRNFDNHPKAGGNNQADTTEKDRPLTVQGRVGASNTPDRSRDNNPDGDDLTPDGTPSRTPSRNNDWNASSDALGAGAGDSTRDKACTGEADNPWRANVDCTPDGVRDHNASSGDAADFTPDRTPLANSDKRPDASQDRVNNRDRGSHDHNIASRDAYSFGAGDNISDGWPDEGSLGYGGAGGGGGGCSLVASRTATTGSSLAYLLVLLAPVAFVIARRRLGRR